MNTVESCSRRSNSCRAASARSWPDWFQDLMAADTHVAEPAVAYGVKRESDRMTIDEYLDFEETSPTKHEYIDGELFAMSGPRLGHGAIVVNMTAGTELAPARKYLSALCQRDQGRV